MGMLLAHSMALIISSSSPTPEDEVMAMLQGMMLDRNQ